MHATFAITFQIRVQQCCCHECRSTAVTVPDAGHGGFAIITVSGETVQFVKLFVPCIMIIQLYYIQRLITLLIVCVMVLPCRWLGDGLCAACPQLGGVPSKRDAFILSGMCARAMCAQTVRTSFQMGVDELGAPMMPCLKLSLHGKILDSVSLFSFLRN